MRLRYEQTEPSWLAVLEQLHVELNAEHFTLKLTITSEHLSGHTFTRDAQEA